MQRMSTSCFYIQNKRMLHENMLLWMHKLVTAFLSLKEKIYIFMFNHHDFFKYGIMLIKTFT